VVLRDEHQGREGQQAEGEGDGDPPDQLFFA